jgi:hypothetical protein
MRLTRRSPPRPRSCRTTRRASLEPARSDDREPRGRDDAEEAERRPDRDRRLRTVIRAGHAHPEFAPDAGGASPVAVAGRRGPPVGRAGCDGSCEGDEVASTTQHELAPVALRGRPMSLSSEPIPFDFRIRRPRFIEELLRTGERRALRVAIGGTGRSRSAAGARRHLVAAGRGRGARTGEPPPHPSPDDAVVR